MDAERGFESFWNKPRPELAFVGSQEDVQEILSELKNSGVGFTHIFRETVDPFNQNVIAIMTGLSPVVAKILYDCWKKRRDKGLRIRIRNRRGETLEISSSSTPTDLEIFLDEKPKDRRKET